MSYEILRFRGTWFKQQEDKLTSVAEQLDCISQQIAAVTYSWDESYRFAPFKPSYQEMVTSLTSGPGGADAGVELLDDLREAIVVTGRQYLRTEAANEGIAAEIDRLIEELDL